MPAYIPPHESLERDPELARRYPLQLISPKAHHFLNATFSAQPSLKRSAEHSKRRKANPYRSALSMLTFYINRAGKNLPASRRKVLDRAKEELRAQFGKA